MAVMQARILIVDDQDFILAPLAAMFERHGYAVLWTNNGGDGLTLCRASSIDLLITDYDMPQMTGLELARECSRIHLDLPVIYISGSQPSQELRAELKEPHRDFLSKPFRPADLLRKAKELLGNHAVTPVPQTVS